MKLGMSTYEPFGLEAIETVSLRAMRLSKRNASGARWNTSTRTCPPTARCSIAPACPPPTSGGWKTYQSFRSPPSFAALKRRRPTPGAAAHARSSARGREVRPTLALVEGSTRNFGEDRCRRGRVPVPTTLAGRMMMHMLGSFAKFERQMIRPRTKTSLDAACAGGRVGGCPRALGDGDRTCCSR
jgi:hypothetical protein